LEAKQINRISIKLNGAQFSTESPLFKPRTGIGTPSVSAETELPGENEQASVQGEKAPVHDFRASNSNGEDALERLNQLRRLQSSDKENVTNRQFDTSEVTVESDQTHARHILMEDDAESEHPADEVRSRFRMDRWIGGLRRGNSVFVKTPGLRLLLSVFSAVTVGLVFGFVVLTVFSEEQMSQTYRTVLDETVQTLTAADGENVPAPSQPDASGGHQDESAAAGSASKTGSQTGAEVSVKVQLPALSLFMAQAGVFSDESAAQNAVKPLEQQGYPHFVYPSAGKYHLYVAAAPNRDDILGMASYFKNKRMEVYIKEVAIPALDKELLVKQAVAQGPATAPGQEQLNAFFTTGADLARHISAWSSRVANSSAGQTTALKADESNIKEMHRRFLEESRAVQAAVPDGWKPQITGMVTGINQAVSAMSQAKTNNAQSFAWQAQKGVLAFLENYVRWIENVK
jgi:hypothetical protein